MCVDVCTNRAVALHVSLCMLVFLCHRLPWIQLYCVSTTGHHGDFLKHNLVLSSHDDGGRCIEGLTVSCRLSELFEERSQIACVMSFPLTGVLFHVCNLNYCITCKSLECNRLNVCAAVAPQYFVPNAAAGSQPRSTRSYSRLTVRHTSH